MLKGSFSNPYSVIVIALIVLSLIGVQLIGLGSMGTTVLIPMLFLFNFLSLNKADRLLNWVNNRVVRIYSVFVLYSCFSILYAINVNAAVNTQMKLVVVFLFALAIYSYAVESLNRVYHVYLAYAISLICLFIYVFKTGIDITGVGRLDSTGLNANTYGYYVATGLSCVFLFASRVKKGKILYGFFVSFLSIYSIILMLGSASRGGFIITSLLILGNLFILILFSERITKQIKVLTIFFAVVSLISIVMFLFNKYSQELVLVDRFVELEGGESPREYHMKKAVEIGLNHPFFGIGAGNYAVIPKPVEQGNFTHNSFTEVFVNYGFLGLTIYLGILFQIFLRIWKNIRDVNAKYRVVSMQLMLSLALYGIYNLIYVTYLSAAFPPFLLAIYSHSLLIANQTKEVVKES